jgi:hypothetical protein
MGEPCLPSVGVAADDYLRARANATRLCLDGLIDGSRQGDPGQLCRGQFVGSVENAPALWAGRERKVVTESERALRREIAECRSLIPPRSGQPARISSDRVVRAYGESVIAATRVSYGEAVPIRDDAVRKCQEHLAAASVNFLAVSSQAMQACIAANLGREDLGAHCLGRLTGGVLDLPRDERARKIIGSAANRLDIAVRENCTNASLEQLDACASDIEGVRNCLQCTNWRRAVDTVASLHGPIDPGPWAESGH